MSTPLAGNVQAPLLESLTLPDPTPKRVSDVLTNSRILNLNVLLIQSALQVPTNQDTIVILLFLPHNFPRLHMRIMLYILLLCCIRASMADLVQDPQSRGWFFSNS
jgi:hypothetical protein